MTAIAIHFGAPGGISLSGRSSTGRVGAPSLSRPVSRSIFWMEPTAIRGMSVSASSLSAATQFRQIAAL